MPIFHLKEHNVLFVHIPRTGGSTIEKSFTREYPMSFFSYGSIACARVTPQHFTKGEMDLFFSTDYFDYSFTIVRNPYERLESGYKLARILGEQGFWGGAPTFSQWLEANLSRAAQDRHHGDNHFRPQTDFLGENLKIFRFEHGLEHILAYICKELGIELAMHQDAVYSTHRVSEKISWKTNDILLCNEFYQADFKAFGYPQKDAKLDFQ
jgi:Sulfotransferase family